MRAYFSFSPAHARDATYLPGRVMMPCQGIVHLRAAFLGGRRALAEKRSRATSSRRMRAVLTYVIECSISPRFRYSRPEMQSSSFSSITLILGRLNSVLSGNIHIHFVISGVYFLSHQIYRIGHCRSHITRYRIIFLGGGLIFLSTDCHLIIRESVMRPYAIIIAVRLRDRQTRCPPMSLLERCRCRGTPPSRRQYSLPGHLSAHFGASSAAWPEGR